MRLMKNSPQSRFFLCLLIGLLGVLLISPFGVQARVIRTIGGETDDEGDPLDSNDYSSGGGSGDTDNDVHDSYLSTPGDNIVWIAVRVLMVDQLGGVVMPVLYNGVPMIQVFEYELSDPTAVTNEK